ncbi:SDR family NAD(P)-dependent oxidoreductase [Streptomyces winkii]|uniref:SDR family NAD(P)-dependent oxidoreductase n=1 Tax=Streptomyces winkii TaxID=3051178 RepID=UPI0028D3C0FA|nr:SDR family NAD(P)-dependent oxidoreductase [Streptomyces sp. DSM 40971]
MKEESGAPAGVPAEGTAEGSAGGQDIAVVGLSLRLPGSRDPEEFWQHLAAGRSLISEVPERRWRKEDHLGHPRREFNKTNSVWGGFVDDVDCFDAEFFHVSPREARSMDPQQRMALELSWHALEDAGYRADRIAGSRTGVFMGVCHWDYAELIEKEVSEVDAYYPTGSAYAIIANRVSHHFDLRGPSVVNDTACASSLVAVQQAVQALQAGDCDHALAGGVNLTWSPRHFIAFAKAGMLSPDGLCRAFDAEANGYVRGEGGGVVLLKRAADARRDGDPVHAVIKGIGSNHGGRTSSLTVTNPGAQAELIAGIYRRAGIAPETVSYVETHGPGTPVGDPIEVSGLKRAFAQLGEDREDGGDGGDRAPGEDGEDGAQAAHRCGIGSVKTNIGHLEGAAGIAGMLKVILAMRHRKLPATVNFRRLNPLITLDGSPLYVVDRLTDWETDGGGPLRAGVSSFGFGGTNAHVVLEAPEAEAGTHAAETVTDAGEAGTDADRPLLLPVSAADEERLRELCRSLAGWARTRSAEGTAPPFADIARTLREGRVPMRERAVFHARSVAEWAEQLAAFAGGQEPSGGWLRGRAAEDAGDGLDADDVAALTERWLERGEEEKFASAWTRGLPVDWGQWPAAGRRVHMPGQVFARTPHWFRPDAPPSLADARRGPAEAEPPREGEAEPAHRLAPRQLAPEQAQSGRGLLGEAVQERDGWHFPLRFEAADSFVRDHVVGGARIVPGVVVLEAVTAAAGRPAVAGARTGAAPHIRNAVWVRPLRVGDEGLGARLRLTASGDGYDYAIIDEEGAPYSSGRLEYDAAPATAGPGLAALRERHARPVVAADGYAALRASGIEHGPALRALHALHSGPDGLLAELRLPAGSPAELALQPAVLDSALLAVLALGTGDGTETGGRAGTGDSGDWRRPAAPAVPFALDGLTAYAPTAKTTWAWLRPAANGRKGAADIDLLDGQGSLCVRLSGYTSRELPSGSGESEGTDAPGRARRAPRGEPSAQRDGELLEVTGVWTPAPQPEHAGESGPAVPVTVLNAALDADLVPASAARLGMDVEHLSVPRDATDDAEAMKAAFAACYPAVQRLLGSSPRRVLLVAPGAPGSPAFAPLAALLKTARQENPSFDGTTVLLDGFDPRDTARFEQAVRTEAGAPASADGADAEVAYTADGRRLRHETAELPRGTAGESLLREGGVYWITGGAGGIGLLLAERLCLRYGATVVLSGRSPAAPAADALAARLARGALAYRSADVTDQESVRALVAAVRSEHGRLDGVFHAAGVLDDGYLATKPLAGTEAVLAPKVDGVSRIDAATRAEGMDFLLVFGSVAGAFGNAAQAGYAVANAYLDAFAERRQAEGQATRAVDWPLWAEGGMRVDDATLAYLRKRTGTVPLPTEQGLDALERALHTGSPVRRVVLFGETPLLRTYAGLERPEAPSGGAPPAGGGSAPRQQRAGSVRAELGEAELLTRTQDFLREQFAEVTLQDAGQIHAEEKLETYGIDSISIVELTSRLEDVFGSLPKTLFFEYVDLRGVAGYFVAEHRARLLELFAPDEPEEPEAGGVPAGAVNSPEVTAQFGTGAAAEATVPPAAGGRAEPPAPAGAPASTPLSGAAVAAEPASAPAPGGRGDIAVVGMAGRYPGAETLEEFWELLSEGRHSFEPVPASRWPHRDLYFDERDVQGKTTVRTGTFLRDVDAFDPRYFSISQRDAELLSPEVRLFLQAGVTALEDAGYSKETLRRRYDGDVGVLVGSMNNSYAYYGFENMLMRGTATSGSEIGVMANMLSYHYGFTGPSMFVDTMCSSSSACVHQALRMLRGGECRMIVVGGINLMLHPYDLIATSQAHFTTKSADVVRSYGLGADGTILGEGVGSLVLKPLADAVEDGDHVYGVIKGSGMTNAGVRNGFTVPSPQQQARAIEKALDDADVDARTVSYLEGHGSATSLGDPIEIKGASLAFGRDTRDTGFCAIGSVKSNVAHLLSGSGLVGITKVLLQLRHRTLAPSLHSETLSPAIDFGSTPFVVQRERAEWRRPSVHGEEIPRRAGVTSIGAGGINVHVVVEEFDGAVNSAPDSGSSQLLVFSAMTPQALGTVLRDVRRHIADEAPALNALAYTLQTGKNELPCRLAFVARSTADAEARLATLSAVGWTSRDPALPDDVRFTESTLRQRRAVEAAAVERAVHDGDLAELAGYWTAGAQIDWDRLWPRGTRPAKLSLPAYPFEKVRCWYPGFDDAPSVLRPIAFTRRAHPWVGVNRSDLRGVRYALEPAGDELLDYVYTVGRTRRFATVALLDGALVFARLAGLDGPLRLRDARWAQLPSPGDATEVFEWRLAASGDGAHRVELWHAERGTLHFSAEVETETETEREARPESEAGTGATAGRATLVGTVASAGSAPSFAPGEAAALRAAPLTLDAGTFYASLGDAGVDARPYARSVTGVTEAGERRLVVHVAEPPMCQDPHKQNVVVPAWVLAALVQGVQHATGHAGATAVRAASVRGERLADTRALVLDRTGANGEAAFGVTFLDGEGRVLGTVEDAEFTAGTLPRSLQSGAARVVRTALPGARSAAPAAAPAPVAAPIPVASDPAPSPASSPAPSPLPAPAPERAGDAEGALVAVLRETVADLLKFELDEIDADTHFHAYGFESIALAKLADEVNGLLGTDLSPVVFFECPDIRSLAEHLRERYDAEETARAVRGNGGGSAAEEDGVVSAPAELHAPAASLSVAVRPVPAGAESTGRMAYEGAVAIVGAAGRFPGAPDADAFWQRLRAGDDLVGEYPGDRFDQHYTDVVARSDFPKFAGRVDDVDRFDAEFFNLSRLEAELMDPQHRLALETVWAALEDGGYAPARLPENTGVWFGVSGSDYHHLLNASGVAPDGFTATGNAHSMLANRISFVLDVHGPSEPVDTACSSSLVALHRAVESIRSGRCDMALAGGVNLLLSVDIFAATHMAGMLSPDGRCKTFSADADGYVRSEGVAAVLLKPLERALEDGDTVWGVVRGSAENHGGRAGSLTAPNARAQAALIRDAMRGTDPDSVGYVEAHGTGTGLGDPVEVGALDSAYRALRSELGRTESGTGAIALGSVKTNIGHAESAAGLAGVLKVLLAMRHGELPPSLHCERLNPRLPLADGGFEVVRELRRWEPRLDADGRPWPLRAGVSSFGFGGANAHVVLEAAPPLAGPHVAAPLADAPSPQGSSPYGSSPYGPQVVVLSARDGERLRISAERLRDFLRREHGAGRAPATADLARTLQTGREAMEARLAFVAGDTGGVLDVLDRFLKGEEPDGWHTGALRRSRGSGVRRDRAQDPRVTGALREGRLDEAAALWCDGALVDWQALHQDGERRTVRLPTYPFARGRYWVQADGAAPPTAVHGAGVEPGSRGATGGRTGDFDAGARAAVLDAVLDGRADPDELGRV